MPRARTLTYLGVLACFALAACALGGGEGSNPAPAGTTEPNDPGNGGAGDDSSKTAPDGGTKPDNGAADAARDGAQRPDASRDAGLNPDGNPGACGVCDRTWVCNNFPQYWASEADGRCVNQKNRTGLRCNGILDGTTANNVGTWTGDANGLTLNFDNLGGGTYVITCVP